MSERPSIDDAGTASADHSSSETEAAAERLTPTPEALEALAREAQAEHDRQVAEAPRLAQLGTVAVIGRPNVGKSTLFNRLVGRRQAIVHDLPGVTRDRISAPFTLPDAGQVELVDTGGLVPGDDPLGLSDQVMLAVDAADALLLVVDGREGLTTADERVWDAIRPLGKPTIVAVNKGDTHAAQQGWGEFYQLGLGAVVVVSAEHGLGFSELHDALRDALPSPDEVPAIDDDLPAIAIVGRPNVGKSSLVNGLLGAPRVLVSPVAGTTRDPIDSVLTHGDRQYRLIDTAGIRRRSQVSGAAEGLAVMFARRQMERADLVVLVVDAAQGIRTGDMAIAGEAWRLGRAVVVVCNKWDLMSDDAREHLEKSWERLAILCANPPRVNLSALTRRHIDKLLPWIEEGLVRLRTQITTGELNRVLERAVRAHSPPTKKHRHWKLFYATQVATGPPTFILFANRTLDRTDSYRRYLENRLREVLDVEGVPIRLIIRPRK